MSARFTMNENELKELKEFVADLKADRAATKEKEKREGWTKYTSLSIVFIAVIAAFASQKGGSCSSRTLTNLNDATYNQAMASDQWSFYQAKAIKQSLAEIELGQLERDASAKPDAVAKIKARIERYDKEKAEITAKAKEFEAVREKARAEAGHSSRQGGAYALAVSIFQIAIAIGSICLVMKRKELWYFSLLLGATAVAQMVIALRL
jgi:hypothetical protein